MSITKHEADGNIETSWGMTQAQRVTASVCHVHIRNNKRRGGQHDSNVSTRACASNCDFEIGDGALRGDCTTEPGLDR